MTEYLYCRADSEHAHDYPEAAYEGEIQPFEDETEPSEREPVVIERWTARHARDFLPPASDVIERMTERAADDMGTDDAADAWEWAAGRPEVLAVFVSALELLASYVHYRVCGEKVGELIVTWDANGEPLLDGQPMYAVPIRKDHQ